MQNNNAARCRASKQRPTGSRLSGHSLLAVCVLMGGCQAFSEARAPSASTSPQDGVDGGVTAASAHRATPTPHGGSDSTTLDYVAVPYFDFRAPLVESAAEPQQLDLLERLRGGFILPPSDDATMRRELAWYARHQEYLDRVFQRSEPYLFHIVGALEERGMPADFALLPIVESAFDPFAYSHGRAAGLWQIIPGTGRRLGLEQDWWFDARRDVLDSTRAALDYLEYLHDRFDGDWLLAVAGYNSGEGNVARALRRAREQGATTDFWGIQRYLPAETRTYVPRLLAIRELVADPAKHGVTLPALRNTQFFDVVEIDGQIDMALAAELAGVETDRLYQLNPGVNRWATDPDGPHRLLIPVERAERFAAMLDELGDRGRVQWTRHRVKPGETLGQLAEKYRTTPAVLREINELRGNLIRAGEHLMIPHALESLSSYSQSLDMRTARKLDTDRAGQRNLHVVRAGESLWTIARRYGVGVRAIASWNAMAPGDVLSIGRELVIWTSESAPAATLAAAQAQPAVATQPANTVRRVTYVVRRGDSLSSIASRFRVTVRKLVEWNRVSAQRYLQPGQRLVMYVNVTEQST
jgi:membrane-bound lytic murein transglycosylase D